MSARQHVAAIRVSMSPASLTTQPCYQRPKLPAVGWLQQGPHLGAIQYSFFFKFSQACRLGATDNWKLRTPVFNQTILLMIGFRA